MCADDLPLGPAGTHRINKSYHFYACTGRSNMYQSHLQGMPILLKILTTVLNAL